MGSAFWNPDGTPSSAVGLRDGARTGFQVEYHDFGGVYAEHFIDGLLHGLAKQFDALGRLILASSFRRGTGTDFWCDDEGSLLEEHPLVRGRPSGRERWWESNQNAVFEERDWLRGQWHGITRRWTKGALECGFPRFYIRATRVSKRAYLAARRRDRTLPPYLVEDDSPARALPDVFVKLRRRARESRARRDA